MNVREYTNITAVDGVPVTTAVIDSCSALGVIRRSVLYLNRLHRLRLDTSKSSDGVGPAAGDRSPLSPVASVFSDVGSIFKAASETAAVASADSMDVLVQMKMPGKKKIDTTDDDMKSYQV